MKKSILGLVLVLVMVVGNMAGVKAQTLVFDPAENDNWYYHGVFYGRGIELKEGEGKGNILQVNTTTNQANGDRSIFRFLNRQMEERALTIFRMFMIRNLQRKSI